MTDDLDSADHSVDIDEAKDAKSRRGRLKDVLNRTKFKIAAKVREEAEVRKFALQLDHDKPERQPDTDLDAFLAAGRVSTASSSRPSIYSDNTSHENISALNHTSISPRPSTSDSKSQVSPRRIVVPRIDVSNSQRFPNAREVGSGFRAELPGSPAANNSHYGNASLLQPVFKSRSQSTTSIASAERKKRIRGLSVGFANAPPTIIGEGGDEAEAPPVEISRAKMRRARSASPQARSPYPGIGDPGHRRQIPERAIGDNHTGAFVPKPVGRVQTGALLSNAGPNAGSGADDSSFRPKPFARTQTGLSDTSRSVATEIPPPLPARTKQEFKPLELGVTRQGTLDLNQEFEMTLGLSSGSPAANSPPAVQEPRIFAPKPQRAPPSYDLIEGAGQHQPAVQQVDLPIQKPPGQANIQTQSSQPLAQDFHPSQMQIHENIYRKAVPEVKQPPLTTDKQHSYVIANKPRASPEPTVQQPPLQQQNMHVPASQDYQVSQAPEDFYQTHSRPEQVTGPGISRFASLHPVNRSTDSLLRQHLPTQQVQRKAAEGVATSAPKGLSPIVTSNEQQAFRSFADRSKANPRPDSLVGTPTSESPHHNNNVRRVSPSSRFEMTDSPGSLSSTLASPQTAVDSPATKTRFYESINQGNPPAGFI